ncbi:MAG: 3-methyl-2-oxobutanoate hydroxymethyltransferase [Candidatus Omnitrophica bacterium]|nr:3-methyl-2-oxobutanoate hydroxymethyltransferase [Candidatus Omnitrophota bacterium]
MNKVRLEDILAKKKRAEKITMLTAYDYPLARVIDQSGIDIILVGDSLANVVLGLSSTRDVNMDIMIHHAKAVRRGVQRAFLVGDMPCGSYEKSPEDAIQNAKRFIDEAGCDGVKLEWCENCVDVAAAIVKTGIPVMGHVGLTPQTAVEFKVQGKDAYSARRIMQESQQFEATGCFSLVLECIPDRLAEEITKGLKIPTIGIGAGLFCDGQVLVTHDLLGFSSQIHPKFVKQYVDLNSTVLQAIQQFQKEVLHGQFPDAKHSYHMSEEELRKS